MEAGLLLVGMGILIIGIYNIIMKKRLIRGFIAGILGIGVIFTGAAYIAEIDLVDEVSGYFNGSNKAAISAEEEEVTNKSVDSKEDIDEQKKEEQEKQRAEEKRLATEQDRKAKEKTKKEIAALKEKKNDAHEKQVKEAQKRKKQYQLEKKKREEADKPSPYSEFMLNHGERLGLKISDLAEHLLSYEQTPNWNKKVKQTEKEFGVLMKELKDYKDVPKEYKEIHKEYIDSLVVFEKSLIELPSILDSGDWKEARKLQIDIQEANEGLDQVHVKMVESGIK